MDVDLSRLRHGELVAGAGGAVLLASLFLMPWYRIAVPSGAPSTVLRSTTVDGWHGLTSGRWLILLTSLAAVGLVFLQATRRAPALPIAAGVAVTILASVTTLWLIYRVLISVPGTRQAGAIVALVASCVTVYGGYVSIRDERIAAGDAPGEIAVVSTRH